MNRSPSALGTGLACTFGGTMPVTPDSTAISESGPVPFVPPAAAHVIDWDHFGEPVLSAARRANVSVIRRLHQRGGHAGPVDLQLYRLPGDWTWDIVRTHYVDLIPNGWLAVVESSNRVDTGNPARQQTFFSPDHPGEPFAVVWLPAGPDVHDSLLMVLHLTPQSC